MAYPKGQHPGATWRKCDFQCHTPRDRHWVGVSLPGTLPARNIRISAVGNSVEAALGRDASKENRQRWLACFNHVIAVLQNNDRVSCSFGTTKANDNGFWKYAATIRHSYL